MVGDESLLSLRVVAGAIATYWVTATLYHLFNTQQPPTSIPWLGYGKGWVASSRNFFALTKSKEWLLAGYEKYSKKNKIFVLPATLGMRAEIVIPRAQMSWMFDQPDSVLSTSAARYEILQGDYCFVEPIILRDPYHEHVVHKNLVRNLNAIISDLAKEVPVAVQTICGMDMESWTKVEVMDVFMKMIPSLTNRMLVGPTLCREPKYLDAVLSFTTDVIRTQTILFLLPKAIHPLVGSLLSLASKYHYWLSSRFTLPLIRKRLEDLRKKDAEDSEYNAWEEPHDFVTWSYRTAMAEGRLDEALPVRIAKRIMPLNFAAIHTTSLTAYETMINVLSADPSVIESLREEAYRVLQEEGGWTKQGLSRMHRMDSAIRESQRASPIALTFIHRKVVTKEGIVTPEGVHVKYGALLSCPWTPLALDGDIHTDAAKFDAFRYSRAREEYDAMKPEKKEKADTLKLKQTGLVTTSDSHLPFGHGRHACPGRFFVSHELKMIFAHMLLNYDFKPLEEKPKKFWVVRFQVPLAAYIEVKRRRTAWQGTERALV
ncbi:cytochrome P450 [Ophiobolus disseminans]|uniref:Cytochrome P450 n=1 Tax=Ophiobolus disseminans TaxID=1469910 RepID=A0A6A7A226_9PLEO|nr:cytochrome P450 [Ophiobolus disseminans]